jgi:hypothetical protein
MFSLPLLILFFSLLQPTHTTSVHDSSSILLAKNTDSLLATIRQAEATTEKLKLKKATASPEEDLEAEISSLKVRLKASPTSCSVVGTQKMEYSFMNGTMLVETIFFFSGSITLTFFTTPLYPPPQIKQVTSIRYTHKSVTTPPASISTPKMCWISTVPITKVATAQIWKKTSRR